MLKIKDNIDLKELEKFGFRAEYDKDTGKLVEMYRINGHYVGEREKRRRGTSITITKDENRFGYSNFKNFWNIFSWKREIKPFTYRLNLDSEDFEVLYDLIKADLVEKVED